MTIDGRTRTGRWKRRLIAGLGHEPSEIETALIDRAAHLQRRLEAFEVAFADVEGFGLKETRAYVDLTSHQSRILRQLGRPRLQHSSMLRKR